MKIPLHIKEKTFLKCKNLTRDFIATLVKNNARGQTYPIRIIDEHNSFYTRG